MVKSLLTLLLRIMSVSLVMQQQGSVSISKAHITTKGLVDAPGLDCHLERC